MLKSSFSTTLYKIAAIFALAVTATAPVSAVETSIKKEDVTPLACPALKKKDCPVQYNEKVALYVDIGDEEEYDGDIEEFIKFKKRGVDDGSTDNA